MSIIVFIFLQLPKLKKMWIMKTFHHKKWRLFQYPNLLNR